MKFRIIFSVLLVLMISVGFNSRTDAAPWRYGCRPVVRYCPPVRVYVPPVVVGGYYGPHYYPAYGAYRNGYRGRYYR